MEKRVLNPERLRKVPPQFSWINHRLVQENLRDRLAANTEFFRVGMSNLGFGILPGVHPIVPVMLGDAALASKCTDAMLKKGVYVIGFYYPVVPQGKARIRTQISAAHSQADMEQAIEAFKEVKLELGLRTY
jgi:glycine C-acetyltransferase